MKWVKASERLPEENKNYCIKNRNGALMIWAVQTIKSERMLYPHEDFEWLEETNDPEQKYTVNDLKMTFYAARSTVCAENSDPYTYMYKDFKEFKLRVDSNSLDKTTLK